VIGGQALMSAQCANCLFIQEDELEASAIYFDDTRCPLAHLPDA